MTLQKKMTLINQYLYSRPIVAKGTRSKEIFWPGCAAMKLDCDLFEKTLTALYQSKPDLGFSSFCCSKPTLSIGSEKQKKARVIELQEYFKLSGVETIYTLCTNCQQTLPKVFSGNVVSAWPMILDYAKNHPRKANEFTEIFKLHDPCSSRASSELHHATREILELREVQFEEFSCSKDKAVCCGRRNMIFITNKEAAEKLWLNRAKELDEKSVLTYCESCVESFRDHGQMSYHLLEVVFNKKAERSIWHKFTNIRRAFKKKRI